MIDVPGKVREILARLLHIEAAGIADDAHLRDTLHADSLDMIEFVLELEDAFGCPIPDEGIRKVQGKVGEAIEYIKKAVSLA